MLRGLAALVWYGGAAVLSIKAMSLLQEAMALRPHQHWPLLAMVLGLLVGLLKGHFLFKKNCQRNLQRIGQLAKPRLWQFFSPSFFVALALMISAGASLSRLAHGSYWFLLAVAALDLAIATALMLSSLLFWRPLSYPSS